MLIGHGLPQGVAEPAFDSPDSGQIDAIAPDVAQEILERTGELPLVEVLAALRVPQQDVVVARKLARDRLF